MKNKLEVKSVTLILESRNMGDALAIEGNYFSITSLDFSEIPRSHVPVKYKDNFGKITLTSYSPEVDSTLTQEFMEYYENMNISTLTNKDFLVNYVKSLYLQITYLLEDKRRNLYQDLLIKHGSVTMELMCEYSDIMQPIAASMKVLLLRMVVSKYQELRNIQDSFESSWSPFTQE